MAPRQPAARPSRAGAAAPRRPARRTRRRRSLLWRLRRPLFVLGVLLVAGVAGAGYVFAVTPLPEEQLQAETTFLYDADGELLAELHGGEDRVSVPLSEVAPVLVDAVIATEDRDFFAHGGIDVSAIARATWADIRAGAVEQGGSTITQQYVKNAFVGNERSLWRKVKEAVVAVKLERRLDKREILERYLNTIYLGRGAYGVQAAAQAYFGKDASAVDLREAAYLAGLIRAPETADAGRPPDAEGAAEAAAAADRRRDLVLGAMVDEGYVDAAAADAARAEPVRAWVRPRSTAATVVGAEFGTEYFVDYVRNELRATRGDAAVFQGGLRVHTTLDLDMQRAAYEAVHAPLDGGDAPAGALVAVDDQGQVKAMVGGRGHAGSKVNLAVGTEGGGTGRQPGSAFKPFVLAEAVEQGVSLRSRFRSPSSMTFEGADAGQDYEVSNYGGSSHGVVDLVRATAVSSNTVYAQLMEEVGAAEVVDLAHRMGIRSELPAALSLTLGTGEVSPLEMAGAYLTLATRGTRIDPVVVTRVTDADGRVLEEDTGARVQALDPAVADQVTHALEQVVERGTGTGAALPVPVAGKTGTTQDNADAWFAGYTPRLSVAVWVGHPEGRRPMADARGRPVTGGSLPASIFRSFMRAVPEAYLGDGFPEPRLSGRVVVGPGATTTTTTSTTTSTTTTTTPSTTAPGEGSETSPGSAPTAPAG